MRGMYQLASGTGRLEPEISKNRKSQMDLICELRSNIGRYG